MEERRNHYRILRVQPDASFEVIRASYRTLMRKLELHPDLGGDHWNAVVLNQAYATLKDPVARAAYDLRLLTQYDVATLSQGSLRLPDSGRRTQTEATGANQRNYYRILQVQPDAPAEVIAASHRTALARGLAPSALIEEAFATLGDPEAREAYDRAIQQAGHAEAVARRAAEQEPRAQSGAGYEPVITRYCLFCKTPHAAGPSHFEQTGCVECASPLCAPHSALGNLARRALARAELDEPLGFYTFWPGIRRPGRLLDLSPTGMRFQTPEALEPGDVLKIDAKRFQAVGDVAHHHRESASTTAGIRFQTVLFHEGRGSFLTTRA